MTGSAGTAPLTYEGLELLASTLARDPEEFDRNIYSQETLMDKLRQSWTKFTETEQKLALQKHCLSFPRIRTDPHPQVCLQRIIELPTGQDANRALRVGQIPYPELVVEDGDALFPTDGWIGKYLEHTRWSEVPLAMHFWAALAVLGVACRRNYYQDIAADYLWMNQYTFLTGPKGNGKSVARGVAQRMLKEMNAKLARREDHAKRTGGYFNALSFQVEIISNDITTPAIKTQLADCCATPRYFAANAGFEPGEAIGVLISDEFSNTAGKAAFGSEQLIPFLTEMAYSDSYVRQTNKDGKIEITNCALSVLACTQPGWMRNTIVSDALAGGFVDRANFIYRGGAKMAIPLSELPVLDPLVTDGLTDFLVEVAHKPHPPQRLMPTDAANRFFGDWYKRNHPRGAKNMDDTGAAHSLHRKQLHLSRMASLLAISEQDTLPYIQESHYQQALRILDFEDDFYQEFISQATESSEALLGRQVLAWVAREGGCISRRRFGAHRKFSGWGKKTRNSVLEDLIDSGQLIQGSGKGGIWYRLPGATWSEESGVDA